MAKVRPGATLPGRTKSLRGAVYFRVWRGVAIACKWPRPRGKPKTPEERARVEWFRQAQKLAARVDAKTQVTIRQAFHRTAIMPRDAATSLMSGRMYALSGPGGLYIRSKRAMEEVSRSLDVISNRPGDTLLRGPEFWTGSPPITTAGAWYDPMPELAWTQAPSTSSFPWKGAEIAPTVPISITKLAAVITVVSGATYRAAIGQLDATRVVTAWTESANVQPSGADKQMLSFDVEALLTPGNSYVLLAGRLAVPNNHVLPIPALLNGSYAWPGPRAKFAAIANAAPGVGSQVEGTAAGVHAVAAFASF